MAEISRRNLLVGFAGTAIAVVGATLGITKSVHHKVALPPPPPPSALTSLLSDQVRLLSGYDRAIAALPTSQAVDLKPLRANVAAHGDALRAVLQNYPGWRLNPTLAAPTASQAAIAPDPAGLRGATEATEVAFSNACLSWTDTAGDGPQIVALLGSISASLSTHVLALA